MRDLAKALRELDHLVKQDAEEAMVREKECQAADAFRRAMSTGGEPAGEGAGPTILR